MRLSKSFALIMSITLVIFFLCSCTPADFGLSEGQVENIISQIEEEEKHSSETVSIPEKIADSSSALSEKTSTVPETSNEHSVSDNRSSDESKSTNNNNALIKSDIFNRETVSEEPEQVETGFTNIHRITNLDELKQFANAVACGHSYAGEQVALEADIDLAGIEWNPIGIRGKPFKGEFLGNGHTISNLTITSLTDKMTDSRGYEVYVGFFGYTEDATIKRIVLENANISIPNRNNAESVYIGAVVGCMFGQNKGIELSECKASGNISVSLKDTPFVMVGGIVGGFDANYKDTYYRMKLLHSSVNIITDGEMVTCGGITGILNSRNSKPINSYITDIVYLGSINETKVDWSYTGGFCGLYNSGYRCDIRNVFINCKIERTKFGPYTFIGVFMGDQCVDTGDLGLENVYGMITCNGKNMKMSMIGRENGKVYFKNCAETDKLPQDNSFDTEKWDFEDPAFPKPNF